MNKTKHPQQQMQHPTLLQTSLQTPLHAAYAAQMAKAEKAHAANGIDGLFLTNINRRQCLQKGLGVLGLGTTGLLGLGAAGSAFAGAQKEEFLVDSVRTALSAAISNTAPPIPTFSDRKSRLEYGYWLTTMSGRIGKRMVDELTRQEFLQTLWYETARAGLEVSLVLGLIQVESNFRKYAISSVGARGLMQVMPFWARVIGDGDASKLFHMQTNLRFGCVILRHYLHRENGNMFMALGRYNGSRGKAKYPDAVFAAQQRWLLPESNLNM